MNKHTNQQMSNYTSIQTYKHTMVGWMDGCMNGRMDEWMEG